MRPQIRAILFILLLPLGYVALSHEFGTIDNHVFSEFKYLPFLLVTGISLTSIRNDLKSYVDQNKIRHFSVTILSAIICCIVVFKILQRTSIVNSKTLLEITNMPGAKNVLTFDFKEDGKFVFLEYDLLGHTTSYGTYKKQRNQVMIISTNYNGELKLPKTGLLVGDTMLWNNFDTMLVK